MDLNKKIFKKEIAGRDLKLEVSDLAKQTNASVMTTYGGTVVLTTVVMDKFDSDRDYFPLAVDYEEKFYAAGKILGSQFIRREGRPSDEATLSGRQIDRIIRPLFDQRIRRAIQVVNTVLSYDGENDPDIPALMGTSAALSISDIPWSGPAAAVRVAKIAGEFKLNPTNSEVALEEGTLDSFIAGTKDRINMIELGGRAIDESDVVEASKAAQAAIAGLVSFQEEVVKEIGKGKIEIPLFKPTDEMEAKAKGFISDKLESAVFASSKTEMGEGISNLEDSLKEHLLESGFEEGEVNKFAETIIDEAINDLVHEKALKEDKRVDGRALDEVRDLYAEIDMLERMHGSALFVRGDTQALAITTLGAPGSEQTIDTIEFSGKKNFMLHYNFPPFSVGEARSFRGPGRRDIGHGALALKALAPLIPSKEEFPYTIRLVSEILSSNGSSSMATVSASSLSLMSAGVPIEQPAAGIAMGLILGSDGSHKVLTDIQGPEDHHGDMDFKVAGTKDGINAIQLDVKIDGLTIDIIKETLEKAKQARLHILEVTNKVIDSPRAELSSFAPRILKTKIAPDRIGELIGPGGKVINGIIENTGVDSIDIEEDGTVLITTTDAEKGQKAFDYINELMRDIEVGEILEGKVAKILEFGAIVEFPGSKSGLLHVSELKDGFVKNVEDVVKEGDVVKVKVVKKENGKISLSLKALESSEK
ncbi:MAG: polyribonucleotide nucleotidyltransferase [Candidatus Colwellbacteria bacterium CG10_big_fil_rev_8_21_14_0_10_41_28]|uniref:Polyribonucleotide nucleotidyltransferase n=1 Tax=Candidatus Colwellbacteria bacterium CG10_big_fil_rev_8_21_14_0_10_41_28 TaxID=1974539 RepID=A0A2H0VH30_9BACT|nr:MAG: polyribonucleotide nucleotidyltransferase [Candidatus Colwellbacteria bacterium CG10_big_fil_rev_8_21_14_0_10_41_28]